MFNTVVLGLTGAPQDEEARALARQLGGPTARIVGARIAVVSDGFLRPGIPDRVGDHLAQAEAIVDHFTARYPDCEGIATTAPSVGRGLRNVARGEQADLVVLASSRRALVGRIISGDDTWEVLEHAVCPVAVAPVGYAADGPLARVVVGFDGSDVSDLAVQRAKQLGDRDSGTVTAVEVVQPAVAFADMPAPPLEDEIALQLAVSRQRLDDLIDRHELRTALVTGRPARELTAAAAGADLLVVGFQARSLLERVLEGSTSRGLLRDPAAPLLFEVTASET